MYALRRSSWLLSLVLVLAIGLGLGLRVTNLSQKFHWIDEIHSAMRVAGVGKETAVAWATRAASDRQPVTMADLMQFQTLPANQNLLEGLRATTVALATDNPQHPPLFYGFARVLAGFGGRAIDQIRLTSALISWLTFPAMVWLAWELFRSWAVALLSVLLLSLSPLHLVYAQEAREYSLVVLLVLVSGALLVRVQRAWHESRAFDPAGRLQRVQRGWLAYGGAIALGLYAHPTFALTIFGHGLWMTWLERFRWNRQMRAWAIAAALGSAAFLPWLVVYLIHFDGMAWVGRDVGWLTIGRRWLIGLVGLFADVQGLTSDRLVNVETGQDEAQLASWVWWGVLLPVGGLVVWSFRILCQFANEAAKCLVLCGLAVPFLALAIPDLIDGGQRSTVPRFLLGPSIGVILAVAYSLAEFWVTPRASRSLAGQYGRRLGQVVTVLLVSVSLASSIAMVRADTWWNKYSSFYDGEVATALANRPKQWVLTGPEKVGRAIGLGYRTDPAVQFLFVRSPADLVGQPLGDRVWLYRPSREILESLQGRGWQIAPTVERGQLLEATKDS